MQTLLEKESIHSEVLEQLLQARSANEVAFILVDVREPMEHEEGHILGVDFLKPTSTFEQWAEAFFKEHQDETIIFTCRTGARSGQVQQIFKRSGHPRVINHAGGITSYSGEIVR
jgi:rhodanese-related sulfurtransferase